MTFFEFLAAIGEEESLGFLQQWTLDKEIPLSLRNRLWERLKWYFIKDSRRKLAMKKLATH